MIMNRTVRRRAAFWVLLLHATALLPSLWVQAARPDHNKKGAGVDVTWSGDYQQLQRRLGQAYLWSRTALRHGRHVCEGAADRARDLCAQLQEARHDRQYRHLYPYLDNKSDPTPEETAAAAIIAASPPNELAEAEIPSSPFSVRLGEGFHQSSLLSQGLTRGGNLQEQRQPQSRRRGVSRGGYYASVGNVGAGDAFRTAVALGIVLAFNSGFINGCCLSGATAHRTRQAVASVTGAYTNSALGLASGNLSQFAAQLQVLLSYIAGSAVAGWLDPRPVAMDFSSTRSRHPALLVAGALLAVSSVWAGQHNGGAGSTGFFLLAAMANGLQNSVTSSATANLCRTTHYTGISTDIGTYVGQIVRGNSANAGRLNVFCGLAAAFWTGGVASYFATQRCGGWALLLGAAIYWFVGAGMLQTIFLTPTPGPIYTTTRFDTTNQETQVEQVPIQPPSQQAPLARNVHPMGSLQSLAM